MATDVIVVPKYSRQRSAIEKRYLPAGVVRGWGKALIMSVYRF
jgi:hypothetical protein